MIVIKIKTWKDWKKDFLDWVQEPRRKTCKDFVDYRVGLRLASTMLVWALEISLKL